jgi:hypothetical protein
MARMFRGATALQKATIFAAIWLVAACPASAVEGRVVHITCETVRAYVAEVGLQEARQVALAHGMTSWQERLARRCLKD